jgi:hypothetical protein
MTFRIDCYRPARKALFVGLALVSICFGKSPPELFIPPELATEARRQASAILQVSIPRAALRQNYAGLTITVDGVAVANPKSWQGALQTIDTTSARLKLVVIVNVHVRPGPHRVSYEWLETESVPEVRTFGGSEVIGGAVERRTQGFIVSSYHEVTHSTKYEDTISAASKQTIMLSPNRPLVSTPSCAIDGKLVDCTGAEKFIKDHPTPR